MKNFYQLTTFVTVISEGSMTAAADKLYLTQPAVSQQIRNLEEDLGAEARSFMNTQRESLISRSRLKLQLNQ